ncbi:translation elongation factor Ts [Lichenifustis flavocetrariae]|uniref:Elongation factor Ts n=1 Tax=Lichenifustis flavocetrariae TaxID=2949735 RepID=A0AA42CPH1_9HYPH|nr:translation elongation factor Ts [Lichenifustis flavocetrariae]MCW6510385.1 translation elongation factor Ts [Lichenifustis flavocetrariae]
MAQITAAMVKDLREKTGVGMMDCKTALNETEGNIESAIDWLRKKGLSKAAKKADRVAAEGLVAIAVRNGKGVVVEVNSETDFVARNDDFQKLVRNIATVAAEQGSDVEHVKAAAYPGGGKVAEAISNAIATIGENMTLRRAASVAVQQGVIGQYMHNAVSEGLGKIGVIVGLESSGGTEALTALGRQIAMHIAAASPLALDHASIDPAVIEREKNVLAEKNAGKPAHVLEKIVDSGLKTFFKEVSLLDQAYIHDTGKSVTQALKEAEKTVGAPIALTGFARFALGEGVEKEATDFAAEVASMV